MRIGIFGAGGFGHELAQPVVEAAGMRSPFNPGYYGSEELRSFGFRSIGDNVSIAANCTIIGPENIEIGDHCRIDGFCTIVAGTGWLKLGNYVHIHTNCVLGCRGGIEMGDFSSLSHSVRIMTASDDFSGDWMIAGVVPFEFTRPTVAPVIIGRHAGIGMGSSILPGVRVGEGAVAFLHTTVRKDLDPWTSYHGNPARRVCARRRRVLEFEGRIYSDRRSTAA